MLTLPIKKQWFDLIKSGIKKEEYRDLSYYYAVRFANIITPNHKCDNDIQSFIGDCRVGKYLDDDAFPIILRNGYSANSPTLTALCHLYVGTGKEEWGAEPGVEYFVLQIERIEEQLC